MSSGYQREITDFLSGYGATGIEIVPGGKHPKVEFEFRGKHVAYTIAGSPSDHRASTNIISELKRTLGEPVPEEIKESRRLSDMLPAAVDRPTFKGKVALYHWGHQNSPLMFRFFLPKTLIDEAGISLGTKFSVSALDQYTWHFHLIAADDGKRHPVLAKEKQNELFYVIRVGATDLTKLGPFGVSPADWSIVGDALVVHLPPETIAATGVNGRRVSRVGRKPEAAQPAASPRRPAVDPSPMTIIPAPPAAAPADTDDVPVAARLRALLAMIQSAERQTGYRLLKVRRDEKHGGVWTWRAPEIRLDE